MKLNTSVAEVEVAERVYFPSASEVVPILVPFTRILTPGNGLPRSVTLPDTVISWPHRGMLLSKKAATKPFIFRILGPILGGFGKRIIIVGGVILLIEHSFNI